MPNDLVSPVNRIEFSAASQAPTQAAQQANPVDNHAQPQANAAAQQITAQQAVEQQAHAQNQTKNHPTAPAKDSQPDSKAIVNSTNRADLRMLFHVDAKTKEVSVLMVDKTTKKVVRTIPADEIKKMNAGDLVELLA